MSVDISNSSIAQWFAEGEQHRCGYCKNSSGSISYGMMTEELTVDDYKDLIDRGWRRSGKYCYKPTLDKTCCPQYTIRCDAIEFSLNKSHKKIIKKFNKFLNDGVFNKNVPPDHQEEEISSELPGYNKKSNINLTKSVTTDESSLCEFKSDVEKHNDEPGEHQVYSSTKKDEEKSFNSKTGTRMDYAETSKNIKKILKDGEGPDPNKPPCKKAKLLRLERKKEKMNQRGDQTEPSSKKSNIQKTLNQFLEEIPATAKHKLKLKLIPTSICGDEWKEAEYIEFELYKKYQMIVHNDPPEKLNKRSFTRFLVSSPLKPKPFANNVEGPGYGSFHQQYWLDNKLIAVGVIDILPGCISSVYFFYDPDYRDLTLGTYGSLRELQLVQSLCPKIPDLRYYYMGFYIHSCPKMRYKGKLNPSFLLCPETYVWVPIEKCLVKLDASKYSRFNSDIDAIDTNSCSPADVNNIKIVYNFKLMYVKDFIRVFKGDREVFENMANLIGRKSAHSIIFWIVA